MPLSIVRRPLPVAVLAVLAALVLTGATIADAAVPQPEPPPTRPSEVSAWVSQMRSDAIQKGISPDLFDRALAGFSPDRRVIAADRYQPEFVKPVHDYLQTAVSPERINNGLRALAENRALLERIEMRYGVDRHFLAAIWGLETAYGQNTGSFSVVRALATLALDGRRTHFGRTQLLAALAILQEGDVSLADMTGSWAGAMGHTQFIPTTYQSHAVDFSGDGRRDVWNTPADALASAANYLDASGWRSGQSWGREVLLPRDAAAAFAGPEEKKSLDLWGRAGITWINGDIPQGSRDARLFLPAGYGGPAFLVFRNFDVIKRYNNSDAYALAIGHLADRLRGEAPIAAVWPDIGPPLSSSDNADIQRHLARLGYDTGGIDGIIGPGTRRAIRSWQRDNGLPVDGFADGKLLMRLKES